MHFVLHSNHKFSCCVVEKTHYLRQNRWTVGSNYNQQETTILTCLSTDSTMQCAAQYMLNCHIVTQQQTLCTTEACLDLFYTSLFHANLALCLCCIGGQFIPQLSQPRGWDPCSTFHITNRS